jgi:uncharacterized protein YunC (DUF1805 family)
MILNSEFRLKKGIVTGVLIKLQNQSLIIINSLNGYLMCGYLDMDVANKFGDIAAKVTGVNTIEEALNAKIVELSDNAKKLGLKTGISGRKFLNSIL